MIDRVKQITIALEFIKAQSELKFHWLGELENLVSSQSRISCAANL